MRVMMAPLARSIRRVLVTLVVVAVTVVLGGSGAATAASSGNVARAQATCRAENKVVKALHVPSITDGKAYAAYLTRALGYVARALTAVRALHWPSPIASALRVEARGLKLEYEEVPAIRTGHVAVAVRLGNQAAKLTHPADLVLERAGLGVCVGSA
jgi:hypothetical protein